MGKKIEKPKPRLVLTYKQIQLLDDALMNDALDTARVAAEAMVSRLGTFKAPRNTDTDDLDTAKESATEALSGLQLVRELHDYDNTIGDRLALSRAVDFVMMDPDDDPGITEEHYRMVGDAAAFFAKPPAEVFDRIMLAGLASVAPTVCDQYTAERALKAKRAASAKRRKEAAAAKKKAEAPAPKAKTSAAKKLRTKKRTTTTIIPY